MSEEAPKPQAQSDPASADPIEEVAQDQAAIAPPVPKAVDSEKKALEFEQLKLRVDQLEQDLKEAKETHDLRKEYTDKLFQLITKWLIVVLVFLILSATIKPYFNLSDPVLIAFITSTTVAVIGLFVIVAQWLFPSPPKKSADDKDKAKG